MPSVMVVTGTSRGIGKQIAEYYLKEGFKVAGCSRGKASIKHKNYSHYPLDVSSEPDVVKMIRGVEERFGRIDVLINNAGIALMNHLLLTPSSAVNRVFSSNFLGSFLFIRESGKVMARNKSGRIINLTTVAVPLNLDGEAVYASSKAAIEELTKIASKELSKFNITVNAVGPTPVDTDLIKSVPAGKIASIINTQAVKRKGKVDDIVNVIDFFIDKKSDFITGQVIYLGGVS